MPDLSLTPDQEQTICTRYAAGDSLDTLAGDYFVHRSTITRVLRRHNVPIRPRGATPTVPPQVYPELRRRHHNGEPLAAAARALGLDRQAARRALKARGDLREQFRNFGS